MRGLASSPALVQEVDRSQDLLAPVFEAGHRPMELGDGHRCHELGDHHHRLTMDFEAGVQPISRCRRAIRQQQRSVARQ